MGCGIQTFRGLGAPVAKVCIAPTVDRIVALAHDWQIGVWNLKTGFLERVFNVPKGIIADNAALEISPDGRQLVYSAGSQAGLWDLTTGQEQIWTLQRGICDCAAFDADGKSLFLFRMERDLVPQDGQKHGLSERPGAGALVGRMRIFLGPAPLKPRWENYVFNNRVFNAAVSRNGTCVVVSGSRGPNGEEQMLKLFEAATGKELWSLSTESGGFCLDALGKYLVIGNSAHGGANLLELPTCRLVDQLDRIPNCLAPDAAFGTAGGTPSGYALFRRHDKEVIVTIGANLEVSSMQNQFSTDGKLVAWGNIDGTVNVCEIEQLRRELAAFHLAW